MKVVALAGGTGSAKLLRGLSKAGVDLTVVANVGDNFWVHGVYVCPDVDIATYTLAGLEDKNRGWGVQGDTFNALEALRRLGQETWFRLGDRDFATSIFRTCLLRNGSNLTEVTDRVRRSLGVEAKVLPSTDDVVETFISTRDGDLHLQEFWVRDAGQADVRGVRYKGIRTAEVTRQVQRAVAHADRVVLCPANPVTSLGPMLAISGFKSLLAKTKATVVALSPMLGQGPFSGPAAKFMKAEGLEPTSVGVAKLYRAFLDKLLIGAEDSEMKPAIEATGVGCLLSDTSMSSPADELRVAKELLAA